MNNPRSDVIVIESLSTLCAVVAVLFSGLFVFMLSTGTASSPWRLAYGPVAAGVAATVWVLLHTRVALRLYRRTDRVTAVASAMVLASPIIANYDQQSSYPAVGLVLAIVASTAILQRRLHVVVLLIVANAAWVGLALMFDPGVSAGTFAATVVRTSVVGFAIHYIRMRTLALLAERWTALAEAHAVADSMSHTDDLTGLLNRRGLHREATTVLDECRREALPLTVLFLDVDGLKQINDRSGHDAGDSALTRVGRELSGVFGHRGTVARVGGDEFVVVLPDTDSTAAADLIEAASRALTDDQVSVSCGTAVWSPDSSPPALDALIRQADLAMYRAKPSH